MERMESHFKAGRIIYAIVPIVAGLDKFTNLLVDWSGYLSPAVAALLPFEPQTFMYIVGVIEIAAGLVVLSPYARAGILLVAVWLTAISLNLIIGGFYDIAVRDLVMAAGAYHLTTLATAHSREPATSSTRAVPPRREAVHS